MARTIAVILLFFQMLGLTVWPFASPAGNANIPWDHSLIFERRSVDEDIRILLRTIVRATGLTAVFKPGVTGTITHRFRNIPVAGAFNMIVELYDLRYQYDAPAQRITFYGASDLVDGRLPNEAKAFSEAASIATKEALRSKSERFKEEDAKRRAKIASEKAELNEKRVASRQLLENTQSRIDAQKILMQKLALQTRLITEQQTLQQEKLLKELQLKQVQEFNLRSEETRRLKRELKSIEQRLTLLDQNYQNDVKKLSAKLPIPPVKSKPRFNSNTAAKGKSSSRETPKVPQKVINISNKYRLSGIGKQSGRKYAVINDNDYFEGDKFNDLVISSIEKYKVNLVSPNDDTRIYIIRFVRRPKAGK